MQCILENRKFKALTEAVVPFESNSTKLLGRPVGPTGFRPLSHTLNLPQKEWKIFEGGHGFLTPPGLTPAKVALNI